MNATDFSRTFTPYYYLSESNHQREDATHVSTPFIVQGAVFYVLMIGSVCGNSLVLAAIQSTPSLWTKTNKILASLTASDLLTGFTYSYYVPYILITSVFNKPCAYNVANTATRWLFLFPPYASCCNVIIVAIDRYVAIVYPLHYETKMTDTVVYRMIAAAWLVSFVYAAGSLLWLINADVKQCPIIPVRYGFADPCIYTAVSTVVIVVYAKILFVAWQQHVVVGTTTGMIVQSNSHEGGTSSGANQQQKQTQVKSSVVN
jgi:7 transmembrane receptor (rhodopsin family)